MTEGSGGANSRPSSVSRQGSRNDFSGAASIQVSNPHPDLRLPATASLIVPFRPQSQHRVRSWSWVRSWWETHFPQVPIYASDSAGDWNKPAAVNQAVKWAQGQVLILSDSDVFIEDPQAIVEAVSRAVAGTWVVPHRMVLRLSQSSTDQVLRQDVTNPDPPRQLIRGAYTGFAGGGLVVLTQSAFWAVGGMDEAFLGWGEEDTAFACALDTLVGRRVRLNHNLWHLYHEPGARLNDPHFKANKRRSDRYRRAMRKKDQMRKLIGLD